MWKVIFDVTKSFRTGEKKKRFMDDDNVIYFYKYSLVFITWKLKIMVPLG